MIEFTDITLNESKGHFGTTGDIIALDDGVSTWMIESIVQVNIDTSMGRLSASMLIHFWYDGRVEILSANRPLVVGSLVDDLRFFKEWCLLNGWKAPQLNRDCLSDQRSYDFWKSVYYMGLIDSDELKQSEIEEQERISKIS